MISVATSESPRGETVTRALVFAVALSWAVLASAQDAPMTANWAPIGPGGAGALPSVVASPTDPNIVLATSDVGGIYRSTDGGQTWSLRNSHLATATGPGFVYTLDSDIVFSPLVSGTVYVGPYKSTDNGNTWSAARVDPNLNLGRVLAIALHPTSSATSYLGTTAGNVIKIVEPNTPTSFHLTDCAPNVFAEVRSLVVMQSDPNVVYAATRCGLFRSTNGGSSFSIQSPQDLPSGGAKGFNKLIQNPVNGMLVAALVTEKPYDLNTAWSGGVFFSFDGNAWYPARGVHGSVLNTNTDFEAGCGNPPPAPVQGWTSDTVIFPGGAPGQQDPSEHLSPSGCSLKLSTENTQALHSAVETDYLPVTPGQRYVVSVIGKLGNPSGGLASLLVKVSYWATNITPAVAVSPPRGGENPLNAVTPVTMLTGTNGVWKWFEEGVVVPPGAHFAKVTFAVTSQNTTSWIDDAQFKPTYALPRTANYTDVAVDGAGNLYAGASDANNPIYDDLIDGVWKSTDGLGQSWTKVERLFYGNNVTLTRSLEKGRGPRLDSQSLSVRTYAGPSTVLYHASNLWLYKSTNGGSTWTEIDSQPVGTSPNQSYIGQLNHVGLDQVALDPREPSRIYYGDEDSLMVMSRDLDDPNTSAATPTFTLEGPTELISGASYPIKGDAATSILLDPSNSNHLWVGFAVTEKKDLVNEPNVPSGVVEGTLNANGWAWSNASPIGTASGTPKDTGGVDLALDSNAANLYATVYGSGVYRRVVTPATAAWTKLTGPGVNAWRIRRAPGSTRMFVAVGSPYSVDPDPNFGVWMTNTANGGGTSWVRITSTPATDATGCTGALSALASSPIASILPTSATTLFVGAHAAKQTGKGGLFKGTCTTNCEVPDGWSWCRVLGEPYVDSIVQSPESTNVLYALAGQQPRAAPVETQRAGLYTSRDGGTTWRYVSSPGLGMLFRNELAAWPSDPTGSRSRTLYAATDGAGLFQGEVTCNAPDAGNPDTDGDGKSDYCDNCPTTANPDQADANQDGVGNMCTILTLSPTPVSIIAEDGRIPETNETSNVGANPESTQTGTDALRIGDSGSQKQWKSILSFDTSALPDNAIVTSATLTLKRGTASGNPYTPTFGTAWVDMKSPIGEQGIEASDFQQASGVVTHVATLSQAPSNGSLSTATLNAAGLEAISTKAPHTQFRIYFNGDDDDDATADYIGYYSGENATAANRPTLTIQYVTP
jgi:photosystem II stability/assembly factor-like uncharacterized protein